MKLLLVEDDRAISRSLKYILEKEGYHVDAVFSVQEAERFLGLNQYNIHILDVRLPDGMDLIFVRLFGNRVKPQFYF
nr:response regulator [Erysipelothrix sp. strain 2 (EsS2-7-Brazil)]